MGMFENTQKITSIVFKPKPTHNFCPLGQLYCDKLAENGSKPILPHYTNHFTIRMEKMKVVCDYIDVEEWIARNINDESLTIEDSVALLYGYMMDTYNPGYLSVESAVDDALHGAVVVTKTSDDVKERILNE